MPDYIIIREDDHIEHHGTKGQKWGVRRYQNADGSLTAEGREHYGINKRMDNQFKRESRKLAKLNERADIDAQTQKWHKYNRKAAKGAAVGAAGVGLATAGADAIRNGLWNLNDAAYRKNRAAADVANKQLIDNAYRLYDTNFDLAKRAGQNVGSDEFAKVNRLATISPAEAAIRNNNANVESRRTSGFGLAADIGRYAKYAGAAVAAAGAGYAVYNKIKASQAKKRVSEVGHTKAVADAKAQLKKMEEMFANTPYEQFIKDMKKAG